MTEELKRTKEEHKIHLYAKNRRRALTLLEGIKNGTYGYSNGELRGSVTFLLDALQAAEKRAEAAEAEIKRLAFFRSTLEENLTKENARLRGALQFYANSENWG